MSLLENFSQKLAIEKRLLIWIVVGFFVVLAQAFFVYGKTLHVGFLLDDFVHLDYPFKAAHGDFSGYAKTLSGNWSGQADGLTSFRPGISTSFMLDYFMHGMRPFGYHLTNLIVFAISAFMCGVIAFQLVGSRDEESSFQRQNDWSPQQDNSSAHQNNSSPQQNILDRGFVASFASLLFLAYPLHVESVAWIVGRVDLHCTAFYLISISLYLRFRKVGRAPYLFLSLLMFVFSLTSKEMAVTLPAVIVFAELFLPSSLNWKKVSTRRRIIYSGLFFGLLFIFAAVRTLLLKTVVGGYGSGSFSDFKHNLRNFWDAPTLKKIIFGVNEEQPFPKQFQQLAKYAWIGVFLSLVVRLFQPLRRLSVFAFLTLWLLVAELPTFQIWHIYPNLVGGRLFYLGSAALCILLAVALVPFVRFAWTPLKSARTRVAASAIMIFGLASLTLLEVCWSVATFHNLQPWIEAGRRMEVLRTRIVELAKDSSVKSIVLLDIPQDYSGAGMVGSKEFLYRMLRPPISDEDYTKKITLLASSPASADAIERELVKRTYAEKGDGQWLLWGKDSGAWIEWQRPQGEPNLSSNGFRDHMKEEVDAELAIDSPKNVKIIWSLQSKPLDPFEIDGLVLNIQGTNITPDLANNMHLVWRSKNQPKSWVDYSEGPTGQCMTSLTKDGNFVVDSNRIGFQPLNFRAWLLNGPIIEFGIKMPPGNYSLRPLSWDVVRSKEFARSTK